MSPLIRLYLSVGNFSLTSLSNNPLTATKQRSKRQQCHVVANKFHALSWLSRYLRLIPMSTVIVTLRKQKQASFHAKKTNFIHAKCSSQATTHASTTECLCLSYSVVYVRDQALLRHVCNVSTTLYESRIIGSQWPILKARCNGQGWLQHNVYWTIYWPCWLVQRGHSMPKLNCITLFIDCVHSIVNCVSWLYYFGCLYFSLQVASLFATWSSIWHIPKNISYDDSTAAFYIPLFQDVI